MSGVIATRNRASGPISPCGNVLEAEAVYFDGILDWMTRGANLTGASDGTDGTVSFWVANYNVGGGTNRWVTSSYAGSGTETFHIRFIRDNHPSVPGVFYCNAKESDGTNVFNLYSATDLIDGAWHHIIASWNSTNNYLYVDDADDRGGSSSNPTGNDIDYTTGEWTIGRRLSASGYLNGSFAEFWFDTTFIDITVEANRRKFISASGTPVNLDTDGSCPTGSKPLIYYSGAASVWNAGTNSGSGGNFTMSGAVTESGDEPVEV